MAFDGIVISNIVNELQTKLCGGRIVKIAQPERDELILSIKNYDTYKLFLSANASLPLVYLTENNKTSPITAPNFCMLLRKHFTSARIINITQPGLERSIDIEIEHLDEMGDLKKKHLIIEIMGKHSNIILCDDEYIILDSIKRVSSFMSSVREVLPGRKYFLPQTVEKGNPLVLSFDDMKCFVFAKPLPLNKAIYTGLTGISPLIANEICVRSGIDADISANTLSEDICLHIYKVFTRFMDDVREKNYSPVLIKKNGTPVEFSSFHLDCYEKEQSEGIAVTDYESVSSLLEDYYSLKNLATCIYQKSSDLRRVLCNAIERDVKKYDLQLKQLKDTEKRETYKVYGELLTAYGYTAAPGAKSLKALNYYTGEEITIPLDPQLTAIENAKKYFDKYNKQKRTFEALTKLTKETKEDLDHLESIKLSLELALTEDDLTAIKEELIENGYIRRHYEKGKKVKKVKLVNKPLHYISSDGFDIYVGRNNFQNDELTFEFANGNDWWFHAKGIPGSHVIVRAIKDKEFPDRVFEEAGQLAAYYSKNRNSEKVEIDYVEKKQVKKPSGGKPGFVVYYTNYSLIATPDISALKLVND